MDHFARVSLVAALLYTNTWAKTVRETLRITWEEGAPNGQQRELIYINGRFPGPNLVWDEDDDVEVTVINDMTQSVTVHWHGLDQRPIQPGDSFVHKFKAFPPGNHWYHSHQKMSLVDGLYGAVHVRPKGDRKGLWSQISQDDKDIEAMEKAACDPEYLVVSDWSQYTSDEYWKISNDSGLPVFCLDSILVNGKGEVYCPGQKFLQGELAPGVLDAFPPGTEVSDKGCFSPALDRIKGGPWNMTERPDLIPPHVETGCVASRHENETIVVDPGRNNGWVSMHIVAAATIAQIAISFDSHKFWLYEVDGNYVNPREYFSAIISAGETFSIMMKLDQEPGRYTVRIPNTGASQVFSAFAEMVYKGHEENDKKLGEARLSYGGVPTSPEIKNNSYFPWKLDTDHMSPWPPSTPRPGNADEEHLLVLGRVGSPNNHTMNAKYLYPLGFRDEEPLLFYPNATLGTENEGLLLRTRNASWVDLIMQVSTLAGDEVAFKHFIHKHGGKTWRIGFGTGVWNYSSVQEAIQARPNDFNLETPGFRDTWITAPSASGEKHWSVLRYYVDNPGPWLLHCHIELHLMGGMGMVIMDGVDAWPDQLPEQYRLGKRL
ncbi:Cupredoxin [Metarhizium album ARSEF 1941]|uniref:Laccase 1 n=1 Tax=Metarhizium album (strain ARSEF 1941) TaxID=1081103 RepID=MLAC1_METAS|nr:Cupredoxin [Metarhizium album ARSEF 1941]A0A0B2WJN5.1 RecName: Full=Laccase 1; AltName: Full=Conidial pigment biosynthesis oxidase Mlac1; Flags: Precursor [Metarhizium album ARSEF 1941]KHN93909.1 Cupredoxin [Metarhizium album ARSEF 1941]